MTTSAFTPAQLFGELSSQTFESYRDFQSAFVERYNVHRFDFPPDYGWRDALSWGIDKQLVRREGERLVVIPAATDT